MPPKQPEPEALQTIDSAALETVGGGASGTDPAITQALTSVLDSLSSLKNNQQGGGMDSTTMMMMMMMMGNRHSSPTVAAPAGTIGGYAGYTIDGVFYPFR